jgi:ribosomal protein S18 acetylase RimI-like enzyme
MADDYCAQMQIRCGEAHGRILVAERQGSVVGFVTVLARQPFTELDDPLGTYAVITDLVVLEPFRGLGIGRRLLEDAEAFARAAGATELRIGVLAHNERARQLYLASGFAPHLEVFAKRW